jgi:hypothetical protein
MRRDPLTSDAYESFIDDCPDLAAAAQATFDRLWTAGEPLFEYRPMTPPPGPAPALERRP